MGKLLKCLGVWFLGCAFLVGFSLPAGAQQVTLDELLKRVEAVEKKNADLQQENASLKEQIQSIQQAQAAAPVAAQANPLAPAAPVPVTSKLKLTIYGYVIAEDVYATAGAAAGSTTAYNNVIEYVAPHYTGAGKPEKVNKVSAQNSRIGVNIAGPGVVGGKTSGQLEIDFNNPTASSSAETYQPRLRQGWAAIDYEKWGVKAGQTWDFFAPLKSSIVDSSGMWRSGVIGYRHPQAYLTNKWGEMLGGKVTTQIGIIDSDDIYQETSGGPVGGAYASYATKVLDRDVTVGAGGILGTSSSSALNSQGKNNNDVYAVVAGLQVKATDWISLKAQGFMGENLANFMAGPYADALPGTTDSTINNSKPLKSIGGFAEVNVKPMDKLQVNMGAGIDDVPGRESTNFVSGLNTQNSVSDSTVMWSTNRDYFSNIKYNLTKDLLVGVEYQFLQTNFLDGVRSKDNRVDTFMQYNF
jgi:hypothetical protein